MFTNVFTMAGVHNERFHCIYFVPVFSLYIVVLQIRAIADSRLGKKLLERGIGYPTFVQEKGRGCAYFGSVAAGC